MNGHSGSRYIPILMYHGIRDGMGLRHPYYETNTSPEMFEDHMQFLFDNGYTGLSLGAAIDCLRGRRVPDKSVVITFDDGYSDFCETAMPILKRYRLSVTIFVVAGFVQGERFSRNGEQYMSWDDLREVACNRVEIGSHTMTHPKLYRLPRQQVRDEIERSKAVIEDKLTIPVHSFAYPYAFPGQDHGFVCQLRNSLREVGYSNGVCTTIGRAHRGLDELFLPRLPINTHDDVRLFDVKLTGGYDWLRSVQYLTKVVKGR
jgi:peptidoglycan/xylan/chitin deacetylase (PgdA/CDA1 family)